MNWWLLAFAALAAGCAGNKVLPPPTSDTLSTFDAASINSWRADGRIAVQRGNEGWSARLRWQQSGDEIQIRLIAPLGRGTYELAGDDDQIALILPQGDRFVSSDARSLMQQQLGWSIPVNGARYWMLGIPAPDAPALAINTDAEGRLKDMQQLGWRISFLRHMAVGRFDLPAKLYLHYDELKVRIAISNWNLN